MAFINERLKAEGVGEYDVVVCDGGFFGIVVAMTDAFYSVGYKKITRKIKRSRRCPARK